MRMFVCCLIVAAAQSSDTSNKQVGGVSRRLAFLVPSANHVPKAVYSSKESIWRISRLLKGMDKRKIRYKIMKPSTEPNIGILGAPLVYGQPLVGAHAAPDLLRALMLIETLKSKGATVKDYGDLEFETFPNDVAVLPGCRNAKTVGAANQKIADSVKEILIDGQQALVIGGDHSVGIGSVYGHACVREDVALLWVDAHADINTPLTSASGNLHGMPVSFLVKELPCISPPVPGLEWCTPCISARNIAFIGLRSVDPGEIVLLRNLGICHFTMDDVWQFGIDTVVKNALQRIDPEGNRPLHVSFDVDAIDPSLVPATGTPVPNGLSFREAMWIAKAVHSTRRLSVMDVVELNPLLTRPPRAISSAQVILDVITRAFTGRRMRHL